MRLLVVAVAALVLAASAASVLAASTTVEIDAALDEGASDDLSFTFTPSSNTTVTATDSISRSGGDVVFSFDSWEQVGGSASGTSNSWTVTAGEQYRVTYEVNVDGSTSEGTYSGTAEVTGSGVSVSEDLSVTVDVLQPSFGTVDTGDPQMVFDDADGGAESTNVDATVENDGQGAMVISDVSYSGVPSGLSVSTQSIPDVIDGNSQGTVTMEVTGEPDVNEGTYSFTMTLTDNLGNTRDATVSVEVIKPPLASVSGDTVDVGDVLNWTSSTAEFTVNEVGGFTGISGMTVDVIGVEKRGSVSVSGLEFLSTSPDGSDTASVTISAEQDAQQHEQLSWNVKVTPDYEAAPSYTFTVTGRVIYPANLERVEVSDTTFPFDQPKSSAPSFEETTEVGIVNSGDLEMEVVSADARMLTGESYISPTVEEVPETVDGLSTGSAVLAFEADDDTPEGEYRVEVVVETADAGTKRVVRTVEITQEPSLEVDTTAAFGEVTITENRTQTIDVSERLGYESIRNLQVQRISGPERWLTVVQQPSATIDPGQTQSLVVAVQFDTEAELYERYRWEYRVSGEGVPTKTITVTAVARPYSFERITEPLGEYESAPAWKANTATPINEMLRSLEQRLRDGDDIASGDLSRGLAAGRATLLFVESLDAARAAQANESYPTAQRALARAAVARDLLRQYVESLEQRELRSTAESGVSASDRAFTETADAQRQHYREVLAANDSAISTAQAHRGMMRIAEFTGDDAAAARHRTAYRDATARYLSLVNEAANDSATAETTYARLRANATVVLAGYPLVLNPARTDAVLSRINRVDQLYASAIETFEHAGAANEADATRERAATVRGRLAVTRYGLFGAIGLYALSMLSGLAFLGVRTYAYVQDASAAANGEFLVDRPA